MADDYNGRSSDGTFASIRQSGPVIRCASGIDWTVPADPATFLAELQRVAPRFSRGYDLTDFRDMCRDLFPEDVEAITPSYSGSAPIVVVGGLNDPATPFRWAEELTDQMGSNVSLVTLRRRRSRADPVVVVCDRRRGVRDSRPAAARGGTRPVKPTRQSPDRTSGTTFRSRTVSDRSSRIRPSTSPSDSPRPRSTPTSGTCPVTLLLSRPPTWPPSKNSGST